MVNKQIEGSKDQRRILKERRHFRLRLFRLLLQARAVTTGAVTRVVISTRNNNDDDEQLSDRNRSSSKGVKS